MIEPLVSIIINCYNGERFLREAINSIYEQNYKNFEIIFWDNASEDDSSKIAKFYDSRLQYFHASVNVPLGEARNLALQKANGKFVAFLDCDDRYLPDKLTKQVKKMEATNCALCYGSVVVIDEKSREINRNFVSDKNGFLLNHLFLKYEINMQTVMIRRSILLKNNLTFDLNLKFSPDYDLFMRIASDFKICSLKDFIVEYRKVGNSLTYRYLDYVAPEMEYTLKKLDKKFQFSINSNINYYKATKMLDFYRALPLIRSGDYRHARRFIFKTIMVKKRYLIYYLFLCLPVNRDWILKRMMS